MAKKSKNVVPKDMYEYVKELIHFKNGNRPFYVDAIDYHTMLIESMFNRLIEELVLKRYPDIDVKYFKDIFLAELRDYGNKK